MKAKGKHHRAVEEGATLIVNLDAQLLHSLTSHVPKRSRVDSQIKQRRLKGVTIIPDAVTKLKNEGLKAQINPITSPSSDLYYTPLLRRGS